ncbi:unnamed protein product [Protopolystoma xenopodis]|uniref:Uncharacterized protein n=1 Tax=Protopolystoma xenopodis TaxID=117903 RepID=A0A3S5FCB7_9PLAT|nr:unnamed protein product [Protopolystoma xenopodis]
MKKGCSHVPPTGMIVARIHCIRLGLVATQTGRAASECVSFLTVARCTLCRQEAGSLPTASTLKCPWFSYGGQAVLTEVVCRRKPAMSASFAHLVNSNNTADREVKHVLGARQQSAPGNRSGNLTLNMTSPTVNDQDLGQTHLLLFQPWLPRQPDSLLASVAGDLRDLHGYVIFQLVQLFHRVTPEATWALERNQARLLSGLNCLAAGLLVYRHSSGHPIRYKLLAVLAAAEHNVTLRRILRISAGIVGGWLDQLLRSLTSSHASCRAEAAICLARLACEPRIVNGLGGPATSTTGGGGGGGGGVGVGNGVGGGGGGGGGVSGPANLKTRDLLYDILASLVRAADTCCESFAEVYACIGFFLQFVQRSIFIDCLLDKGPLCVSPQMVSRWPRLLAYIYTYWEPRILQEVRINEKRAILLLDSAFMNPVSRLSARMALAAFSGYTQLESQILTQYHQPNWTDDKHIQQEPADDQSS